MFSSLYLELKNIVKVKGNEEEKREKKGRGEKSNSFMAKELENEQAIKLGIKM